MMPDYDFIVVGSGFGGSVAALRLAQKGYRTLVLEQGRRILPEDMRAAKNMLKLFWMPDLGLKGFFTQTFFRNLIIVGGVGVGGGSLVYAAVLIEPEKELFDQPAWGELGIHWADLAAHYATAKSMLGRTLNPYFGLQDEYLKRTAESMQAAGTFGSVPLGIYFGEPGKTVPDPFFGGEGPQRTGCDLSGACLTGCASGSKISLDLNYLYLAQKLGGQILPEHQATLIRPLAEGGYEVETRNPLQPAARRTSFRTQNVILSGGVIGTLSLLFHCRDEAKTLPAISREMGNVVRTNSEAIVGVLPKDRQIDVTRGTTISTDFYPNKHTHITQNRFPEGYSFMKWYGGPLVDDAHPLRRALKTLREYVRHPLRSTASWRAQNWYKRVIILTTMQQLDNQISFSFGRSLFTFFKKGLISKQVPGKSAPTFIPEANEAARVLARHVDGDPLNVVLETMLNMSTTAHILGGCQMGTTPENGAIAPNHELFNYPGIYVMDGSVMPVNLGVNPALTITALSERAMGLIPVKNADRKA